MRTRAQIVSQLKASKASAAKRKRSGMTSMEKSSAGSEMRVWGTDRVSATRTRGWTDRAGKERAKSKMAGNKKLTMAKYVGTKNGDYTEINAHTFAAVSGRNRKLANKIAGAKDKTSAKRRYSRRSIGEE